MDIEILDNKYNIIDTKEKITIADSFIVRSNKIGNGNGEAKLYVGERNDFNRKFFGGKSFRVKCFLLKSDLLKYLEDCKEEYLNPQQQYKGKDKMEELWEERLQKVNKLNDIEYFELVEQDQIIGNRMYVKSSDSAYQVLRFLSLPNISYLSTIKLKDKNDNIFYYFKPFVDYFEENEHFFINDKDSKEVEQDVNLDQAEKLQVLKARVGQGKYRESLLRECPFCPITTIADDRLLIASHIKPWIKSNSKEKIDPKNGFMFTPTYDKLFDRGFISFKDDKKIILSPWLSKMTCSKLKIAPNKFYSLLPMDEKRKEYLKYHRENIFKR